jgi:hypothetical protein
MQGPQDPSLIPTYPPLTGAEAEAAVQNQIFYYPKVVRSRSDEPVERQDMGLISFVLLKEMRQTKEGKRLLGFFKLRGNWADENQATNRASGIVRNQDSKYPVRVCDVGEWLPLIDDDAMAKKTVNVTLDENDEEKHRQEAFRQTEEKKRQHLREIKEREEEVRNAKDINEDPESLNYYTMKRVVWMSLRENIERKRNELVKLEEKLVEVRGVLGKLDSEHSEYQKEWVDNYNVERKKAGFPDFIPSTRDEEAYLCSRVITLRGSD